LYDRLSGKADVPSCLILDVRLRHESGLALQEDIAKSRLRIPVLFITSHGDIEMSVRAMKAGALDFLTRPFRDQDMLDAVANALTRDSERLVSEQIHVAHSTQLRVAESAREGSHGACGRRADKQTNCIRTESERNHRQDSPQGD
jgi:FixJ family two-component response regulator